MGKKYNKAGKFHKASLVSLGTPGEMPHDSHVGKLWYQAPFHNGACANCQRMKVVKCGHVIYHFAAFCMLINYHHHHHHHHSFNMSVPLKVGRMAPMFVLSFFLHSILFAGSALDSFQCLRSLLIVSFHVFFGLPRPRCPTTSNSVMLLIQPSFLTTCPNQRSRLYHNKVCMCIKSQYQ